MINFNAKLQKEKLLPFYHNLPTVAIWKEKIKLDSGTKKLKNISKYHNSGV